MTRRESGSATVYVAILAALCSAAGALTVVLARVSVQRARAAAAADLAALAAAGRHGEGPDASCSRAREIAAAHGAVLEHCAWSGAVVTVRVRIDVTGLVWLPAGAVRAESRAGPQA